VWRYFDGDLLYMVEALGHVLSCSYYTRGERKSLILARQRNRSSSKSGISFKRSGSEWRRRWHINADK